MHLSEHLCCIQFLLKAQDGAIGQRKVNRRADHPIRVEIHTIAELREGFTSPCYFIQQF